MRMHALILRAMVMLAVMATAAAQTALAQTSRPSNTQLSVAVRLAANAKDTATALAKASELEASAVKDVVWADNTRALANLMWRSGQHAEAAAFLAGRAAALAEETKRLTAPVPAQRRAAIVAGCLDLIALEADPAAKIGLAKTALAVDESSYPAFTALYAVLVADKQHDAALRACLDYMGKATSPESMRDRRMTLLVALKRTEDLKGEALEYLKVSRDVVLATRALAHILPADDVALCCGLTAQQVLDGRKLQLRKTEGRLHSQKLLALADQLTKGGSARPLRVSDEAKALAENLKDAPLSAWLVPLLKGEHAAAYREAYARAKAAETDADYVTWINSAAGAIRCREQHYNGKALEFIHFVNGKTAINPVADMVSQ
jgi:hypothetical protein